MKSILFIAASIVLCTSEAGVSAIRISNDPPLYKDGIDEKRAAAKAKKEAEEVAEAARLRKKDVDDGKKGDDETAKKEKAEKAAAKAAKKAKEDAWNKELDELKAKRSHTARCRNDVCKKVKNQGDGHVDFADDEETIAKKQK